MGEIRRIAFLYPGQGAQKTGMAQDFYEKSEAARSIFERAMAMIVWIRQNIHRRRF